VWQTAHEFVLAIYRTTDAFPRHELYGITPQLRRAAVSVPTNIAEGSKRSGRKEYAHFLNIAEASMAEVTYLLILARDLGYLGAEGASTLTCEAEKLVGMLFNLRKRVERNDWVPDPGRAGVA
jgi:four helix bundle protein